MRWCMIEGDIISVNVLVGVKNQSQGSKSQTVSVSVFITFWKSAEKSFSSIFPFAKNLSVFRKTKSKINIKADSVYMCHC